MSSPADLLVTGLDPDNDAFWTGVSGGRIPVERCTVCESRFVLPLPSCPTCGSPALETLDSSGRGSLYTWVVVHYAFDEQLAKEVPYVIGAIELDEGARIFARVEGIARDALAPDLRLVATFPQDADRPPIVFVPEEGSRS
jgi:uncharacterized OB-fold protein